MGSRIQHARENSAFLRSLSSTLRYKERGAIPALRSRNAARLRKDGQAAEGSEDGRRFVTDLGKLLIVLGAILLVAGVVLSLLGRTGLPLGRLPGDIVYRGKNTTLYFPLATSILLSVILTVVLYVIGRWRR